MTNWVEGIEKHKELWETMAKTMSCGNCGCTTTVESKYVCKTCGRMLCDRCGIGWGLCKDHLPKCYHPELVPTQWEQIRPAPATVIGGCRHNYSCPVCGFGTGCYPDPCANIIKELEA
jgi:hypothetical protein